MVVIMKHTFIFMIILMLLSRLSLQQTYSTFGNVTNHEKKHFVLVHGAGHGAWCWYKLATLLRSAGHNVTALDLAASGINQKQVLELRSISDYHEPLLKFMESIPANERVILVGHSFGGFGLSQAMETFPEKIAAAVFLTALMPGPNNDAYTVYQKAWEQIGPPLDLQITYDDGPDKPPTTFLLGPKYLSAYLYQLSPPEDLTLATTLVRPTRMFSKEDINKEIAVSDDKYGKVSRVFIISDEDESLTEDFQRWMIEKTPGAAIKEINGSDHMVMLSKPQELYSLLNQIATEYFSDLNFPLKT